jgi:hypothetical protein
LIVWLVRAIARTTAPSTPGGGLYVNVAGWDATRAGQWLGDRIAELESRGETKDIRAELTSNRRDLEALTGKVDNIIDLPKEIDHALERIAAN